IKPNQEIVFVGKMLDKTIYRKKIIHWIKNQARQYLTQLLKTLSQQTHLYFDSVTIRDQKTRWGSCSSDKTISLNYKLIFLPEHLVRHVLIHELCHTIYLNHSDKFWHTVATFDANWREHRRELRKADQYMPVWV